MKTFLITEKFQKCFCNSIKTKSKSESVLQHHYSELLELERFFQKVKIPDDIVGDFICKNFMNLLEYALGTPLDPSKWLKYPQDERFLIDLSAAKWRKDWKCFYSLYEPTLDNILYWAFKQEVVDMKVERNGEVYGNFERARIGGEQKDQKRSSFWSFFGFKHQKNVEVFKCVVGEDQDNEQDDSEDSEDDLVWHESPIPRPIVVPKVVDKAQSVQDEKFRRSEELKLQDKLADEERKAVEDMREFNDTGTMVFGKSLFYVGNRENQTSKVEEQKQETLKNLEEFKEKKLQAKLASDEKKTVEAMERFNEVGRMVLGKSTSYIERRGSLLIRPFSRIGQSFQERMADREREEWRRLNEMREKRRRMDLVNRTVSVKIARAHFEKDQEVSATLVVPSAESAEAVIEPVKTMNKDNDESEEHYELEIRLITDDDDDDNSLYHVPVAESSERSALPEPSQDELNDNESIRFADSSDSEDEGGDSDETDLEDYLEPEGTLEYLPAGWVIGDKNGDRDQEDRAEEMGLNEASSLPEEETDPPIQLDSEVEEDQNQNTITPDGSHSSEVSQDITLAMEKLDLDFQHQLAIQKRRNDTELQMLKHKRWMQKEEMKIRMNGRASRRTQIQEILFENPVVLFSRTLEIEKSKIVMEILKKRSVSFYHVSVDNDVEIRLGIKEFTGKEVFPQLLINGEYVEVDGLEEYLNDNL